MASAFTKSSPVLGHSRIASSIAIAQIVLAVGKLVLVPPHSLKPKAPSPTIYFDVTPSPTLLTPDGTGNRYMAPIGCAAIAAVAFASVLRYRMFPKDDPPEPHNKDPIQPEDPLPLEDPLPPVDPPRGDPEPTGPPDVADIEVMPNPRRYNLWWIMILVIALTMATFAYIAYQRLSDIAYHATIADHSVELVAVALVIALELAYLSLRGLWWTAKISYEIYEGIWKTPAYAYVVFKVATIILYAFMEFEPASDPTLVQLHDDFVYLCWYYRVPTSTQVWSSLWQYMAVSDKMLILAPGVIWVIVLLGYRLPRLLCQNRRRFNIWWIFSLILVALALALVYIDQHAYYHTILAGDIKFTIAIVPVIALELAYLAFWSSLWTARIVKLSYALCCQKPLLAFLCGFMALKCACLWMLTIELGNAMLWLRYWVQMALYTVLSYCGVPFMYALLTAQLDVDHAKEIASVILQCLTVWDTMLVIAPTVIWIALTVGFRLPRLLSQHN